MKKNKIQSEGEYVLMEKEPGKRTEGLSNTMNEKYEQSRTEKGRLERRAERRSKEG